MKLIDRLTQRAAPPAISLTDWARSFAPGAQFNYGGNTLQSFQNGSQAVSNGVSYDRNSVVFAVAANRMLLFSEARFQFQQLRNGRPGDLFGTKALATLETPWPGASTRELLAQAELDVTLCGNSYWVINERSLLRLEPQHVRLLTVGAYDEQLTGHLIGERLGAYAYTKNPNRPVLYLPEEIADYKPYPNQSNRFLGASWLSACLPDIASDDAITLHKQQSLANGANLGAVVSSKERIKQEEFDQVADVIRRQFSGPENAGKTLLLNGGVDVKTVGQTFENLALRATQGAGETRIAACGGVPPVIVGLSEGLAAATYSNYGQAKRRLADGTMRPLWGSFASAFSSIVPPPENSRLWYDDRDIPYLREDTKDQGELLQAQAVTIKTLVEGGFKPESVVDAVMSGDFSRLEHSGLLTVQLQDPSASASQNQP